MSAMKRKNRWILALLVIMLILFIYRLTLVPEQEDEIPEQIEELEWEEIDKVEVIGKDEVYIVREEGQYSLLLKDTIKHIPDQKIIELFKKFNNFQQADLKPVDFEKWIKQMPDTSYVLLKLYKNTEEVLNLYITTADSQTYFRYTDSRNIYKAEPINHNQFLWLDSLIKAEN